MFVSVSTGRVVHPATRYIALFGTVLACGMTGLPVLSLVSGVHTTVHYGWEWITAWLITLIALLASLVILYYRKKDAITIRIAGGKPYVVLYMLCGAFGFSSLAAGAVFSGVPIVLHYLTSRDGELTVTVTGKEELRRRYACEPRLLIKEFTFYIDDHICPGIQAFQSIDVGARITLKGEVSPFGINVEQVIWNEARNSSRPGSPR